MYQIYNPNYSQSGKIQSLQIIFYNLACMALSVYVTREGLEGKSWESCKEGMKREAKTKSKGESGYFEGNSWLKKGKFRQTSSCHSDWTLSYWSHWINIGWMNGWIIIPELEK